jgi:AraC family transcriptional regulator, melibiose operon regulatory protein
MTLDRYFKRFLKCTLLNYVIDYRIQKSLYLLQQGDSNITEVAYQVGFNSTSYFIKEFRNSLNMTPLSYKKDKMHHHSLAVIKKGIHLEKDIDLDNNSNV